MHSRGESQANSGLQNEQCHTWKVNMEIIITPENKGSVGLGDVSRSTSYLVVFTGLGLLSRQSLQVADGK